MTFRFFRVISLKRWQFHIKLLHSEVYRGIEFYPQELVRRCILAGCPVDGTVLDPFIGSGTSALVARKHGRRCIGIELSADYCELAAKRTQQLSLEATA